MAAHPLAALPGCWPAGSSRLTWAAEPEQGLPIERCGWQLAVEVRPRSLGAFRSERTDSNIPLRTLQVHCVQIRPQHLLGQRHQMLVVGQKDDLHAA